MSDATSSAIPPQLPPAGQKTILGMSHIRFYQVLSVVAVFTAWEIAGLVPISIAFPTFTGTMRALFEMIVDGRLFYAYIETLKPLSVGVLISASFGITIGIAMGLNGIVKLLALV